MGYSKKVIDLFIDPDNEGELTNADAVGQSENRESADFLQIYLGVSKDRLITDAKFTAFGCCESVAAGSMVTIMAKGRKLAEAETISADEVLAELNGLPGAKAYCAELAVLALKNALNNWLQGNADYLDMRREWFDAQN